jgi:hypothetical protein
LETGEAICKVERADHDFNLSVPFPESLEPAQAGTTREAVVRSSREKYATPRAKVEAALWDALRQAQEEAPKPQPKPQPVSPPLPKDSEPKPSKIDVPTVSEKENPAVEQPVEATLPPSPAKVPAIHVERTQETKPAPVPEDKGIGGHQHNVIRQRIQAAARELGFYAEREKPTATGQKIDLALERRGQVIACEISIMTTADHEVGNVAKCLKAGCQRVAVISPTEARLEKIRKAVAGCTASGEATRVGYYLPEQFIEYLKSLKLPEPQPAEPRLAVLEKFNVRVRASARSKEEVAKRQDLAHKAMASVMKPKR